jgi:hypothetical protein
MVTPEKDVLVASPGQHQHCRPVLRDQRLERLIDRLPGYLQSAVRRARRPSPCWARVPAGVFLIGASILLGFWMLPLGLVLLAEDFPPARWAIACLLDWIERRWPQLLRGTSQ